MAAVDLKGVVKSYDGKLTVIHGIDLQIRHGEFVVFVGPSGCGKSTLLRMIAGLETISGGEVCIDGTVVNDLPPRARDIAMVFQDYALYPHKNLYDNMAFGLRLRKTPEERNQAARDGRGQAAEDRPHAGAQARGAVGRPAPARGHRPGHRAPAQGVPVRRAAVQPRRATAPRDAQRDQAAAPAAGRDDHLRHPRPGRGDDDGRPHRGAEAGKKMQYDTPDNIYNHPAARVRRRLHRRAADEPGRLHAGRRARRPRRHADQRCRANWQNAATARPSSSSASGPRTSRWRARARAIWKCRPRCRCSSRWAPRRWCR